MSSTTSGEPAFSDPAEGSAASVEQEDLSPARSRLRRLRDFPTIEVFESDLDRLGELTAEEQRRTAWVTFCGGAFLPLLVTALTIPPTSGRALAVHIGFTVSSGLLTVVSGTELLLKWRRRREFIAEIRRKGR